MIQTKLPHRYAIFDFGTGLGIIILYPSQKEKYVVLGVNEYVKVIQKGYVCALAEAKNLIGVCDALCASVVNI